MRRNCPHSRAPSALLLASVVALAACADDDAKPAPEPVAAAARETAQKQPPKRPPFPNMATAAWGSTVMERRLVSVTPDGALSTHIASALAALHSLDEGAAAALAASATSVFASAESDGDRALGAALVAAGLVLEPTAMGYKERLTDAHGLAAFAATFEGGTSVAQAARAFVAVAAGRVFEGEKLVDVMSTSTRLDADTALLLSLARHALGQRGDELFHQARIALDGKPESARARGLLARVSLDLGLAHEALGVLDEGRAALGEARVPAPLVALRGRALMSAGDVDEGARVLEGVLPSLPETERGEVRYWLARELLAAGRLDDTAPLVAELKKQPGFAAEAALLDAELAAGHGKVSEAKAKALKVCTTRGLPFGVALDCLWTATETCALAGDAACVSEWGAKAVGSDDDFARLARARATLAQAKAASAAVAGASEGTAEAPEPAATEETRALLSEAHLLSPFDAALGRRLDLGVSAGGDGAARTLRGARRALAFDARKVAEEVLTELTKQQPSCRVCRAVLAQAPAAPEPAAVHAVAALSGKGPPLAERDLLEVIDVLGGSSTDAARDALARLAGDARPEVQSALRVAQKEQANPEARAARKAKEAKEPATPGTVPVPGLTPHDHE